MLGGLDFEDGVIAAWRERAACKGRTDIFYPPPFGKVEEPRVRMHRISACKTICDACPVFDECQEWAMKDPNEGIDMVLAGLTYEERRGISRGYRGRY